MTPEGLEAVAAKLVSRAASGDLGESRAADGTWRSVSVVDSHTSGMPTRIIVDGFSVLPGTSVAERVEYVRQEIADELLSLLREPRGHAASCGVLVQPPIDPTADVGAIYLCTDGLLPVCGHASMGMVDALLRDEARSQPEGWEKTVTIETAGGILMARATRGGSGALEVGIEVPAAEVVALDAEVGDGSGSAVRADIARCGGIYAIVKVADAYPDLVFGATPELRAHAEGIMERVDRWASENLPARLPKCTHVVFVEEQVDRAAVRTLTVHDGFVDRSPCGTGSAALASVYARRRRLEPGEEFLNRSMTGGAFRVRVEGIEQTSQGSAARSRILGGSRLLGVSTQVIDRRDPMWRGFTW